MATRVPSDSCAVVEAGRLTYPHVGQWVEVKGRRTILEIEAEVRFDRFKIELAALLPGPRPTLADDLPDEEKVRIMEAYQAEMNHAETEYTKVFFAQWDELLSWLAPRVVRWNWTDGDGEPYVPWNDTDEFGNPCARLDGTAEQLKVLSPEEVAHLRRALRGEVPFVAAVTEPVAASTSSSSPTTSSDSSSRATRRNGTAPSPTLPSSAKSAPSSAPV